MISQSVFCVVCSRYVRSQHVLMSCTVAMVALSLYLPQVMFQIIRFWILVRRLFANLHICSPQCETEPTMLKCNVPISYKGICLFSLVIYQHILDILVYSNLIILINVHFVRSLYCYITLHNLLWCNSLHIGSGCACGCTPPNHYLNQCWVLITFHWNEGIFTVFFNCPQYKTMNCF